MNGPPLGAAVLGLALLVASCASDDADRPSAQIDETTDGGVGAQLSDELTEVSLDASGDSTEGPFVADGLPRGLTIDADTGVITGTIDHRAADGTTDKNEIDETAFSVTVTREADEGAESATTSFVWTVRDTHLEMPDYVDPPRFGCGASCNEPVPNVTETFDPVFRGFFDPEVDQEPATIWRQSIAPSEIVRYGQEVTFHYFDEACAPCDTDIEQGHPNP